MRDPLRVVDNTASIGTPAAERSPVEVQLGSKGNDDMKLDAHWVGGLLILGMRAQSRLYWGMCVSNGGRT